ncbi:MAG: 50S ribosomal protein L31 [Anaerolineales bacterium]|nr:50S ribosomal protein L31 [Anaerolineales bacterium]MCB0010809.1 50S ribosomal protein L31 [Anaerolineales bacterium]MCB0019275.1 50S ribosomal protein L31 [Anaerolineales bacterium]MCB0027482.1 50S ribosomal protein L31 [Anaerolineales bacterium]MCB8960342.1 50S ribosomal protein L31 [Ardenticatenales bacterium]
MKKDIHPQWYPDAKVICDGEVVMTVGSTQPEIRVDIWSGNHPFYTGQQRLVDTEGQVDRFMRRLQRRTEIRESLVEQVEQSSPTTLEIGAMGLGKRVENALADANLTTVGDVFELLQSQGEDGLLALQGVGQKALIDIKRYLRAEGLIE